MAFNDFIYNGTGTICAFSVNAKQMKLLI